MDESRLPHRLFLTGGEPSGRNRVNNYFNLRWIENIKKALDEDHLEKLANSQFGHLMLMGNHTFSVMFVHYILSRQLVTDRKYELWWVFARKPIRYALQDFAVVTGLNCGKVGFKLDKRKGKAVKRGCGTASAMWKSLFGSEPKPTVTWILQKLLLGKKYRDADTRFRLALLVLVDGILCPTCGNTNISPEHVELVADTEAFLKYPWGRDSFLKTVKSAKARTVKQLAQDTCAIQGFSHALVLVTVACCPAIIQGPAFGDDVHGPNTAVEGIVQRIVKRSLTINVQTARVVDQTGQACVCSLLAGHLDSVDKELVFTDEEEDENVTHLVEMVLDEYPFEHNSWSGGVDVASIHDDGPHAPLVDDDEECDNGCTQGTPTQVEGSRASVGLGSTSSQNVDVPTLIKHAVEACEECFNLIQRKRDLELMNYFVRELQSFEKKVGSMLKAYKEDNPPVGNVEWAECGEAKESTEPIGGRSSQAEDTHPSGQEPNESEAQSRESNGDVNIMADVDPPTFSIGLTQLVAEETLNNATEPSPSLQGNEVDVEIASDIVDLTQDEGRVSQRRSSRRTKRVTQKRATPTRMSIRLIRKEQVAPDSSTLSDYIGNKACSQQNAKDGNHRKRSRFSMQSEKVESTVTASTVVPLRFVGGFDAFSTPDDKLVEVFLREMERARSYQLSCGMVVDNTEFLSIYTATTFLDELGADMLVKFIQARRDASPNQRFDFIPASFLSMLYRQYNRFGRAPDKATFPFSDLTALPFRMRPNWFSEVDILYSPMQIERQHWIALVIDLTTWQVMVLDCNKSCLTDQQINKYVEHVAVMLPYLIRKYVDNGGSSTRGLDPLSILRPSIPFRCSNRAYVGVASLILLELHAVSSLATYYRKLDEEKVQIAAKQYALGAFATFSAATNPI